MAVVTISRQTYLGGKELGRNLADKLGYTYYTLEELAAEAVAAGVDVERLRASVTKPPGVRQELRRERDRYVACVTRILCEKILHDNIVYNGHAGHMLLLGIPNILRIAVVADLEFRIRLVHDELGYSRKEAREYIRGVDVIRDRWVRYLYGVDWHNPFHYDVTIHASQTGFEHAAEGLLTMAHLPEFQLNAYSIAALQDLRLANLVHFSLATDDRTRSAEFHVTANRGMVQITAQPRFSDALAVVDDVLSGITGIEEITTCAALDSILYVSERFDRESEQFRKVIALAERWHSGVELITLPAVKAQSNLIDDSLAGAEVPPSSGASLPPPPEGLRECHDHLKKYECCGGCHALYGTPLSLVPGLQRRTDCRLLIMGQLYRDRPDSTRVRLAGELTNQLTETLTFPVVDESELDAHFRFGFDQALRMILWLLMAAGLLAIFFVFHNELLAFLASELDRPVRMLSVIGVVVFAPLFAYAYGSAARSVLRLMGLD